MMKEYHLISFFYRSQLSQFSFSFHVILILDILLDYSTSIQSTVLILILIFSK